MVEKARAGDGAELRSSGHNEDLIRPESGVRPARRQARPVNIRHRPGDNILSKGHNRVLGYNIPFPGQPRTSKVLYLFVGF